VPQNKDKGIGGGYYGAYNSTKIIDNIHKIDNLCSISNILNGDEGSAKIYGQIKKQLKQQGTPIAWLGIL
jgi:predicted nucleic acid-binding protein